MSIYLKDFTRDAIGSVPTDFSTVAGTWAVYNDSGNVLRCASTTASVIKSTVITSHDNFIFSFRVKFTSTATSQWRVIFRSDVSQYNRIDVGCLSGSAANYIDIYECINNVSTQRAHTAYTYGTGWHNVVITAIDGSIVVRIGSTEIHYDSISVLSGERLDFYSYNTNTEFDDIVFITHDFICHKLVDDAFNNNSINAQWQASVGAATGCAWAETTELKLSGTASASVNAYLRSSIRTPRRGWYQEIKFKMVTGTTSGQHVFFRISNGTTSTLFDIRVDAIGYYMTQYIRGVIEEYSSVVSLFGNETTTFHTLKMLWDEYHDAVWAWVDNIFIGRLSFNYENWTDFQQTLCYVYTPVSAAVDYRFKDFVARSVDPEVRSPLIANRPDMTYDAFL